MKKRVDMLMDCHLKCATQVFLTSYVKKLDFESRGMRRLFHLFPFG